MYIFNSFYLLDSCCQSLKWSLLGVKNRLGQVHIELRRVSPPLSYGIPPGSPSKKSPPLIQPPPPPEVVGIPGEPVSIATLLICFYASTTDTSVCKDKLVPRVLSYPLCKECSNYLLILLDRNSIARIASPVPRFLLIPMPFGRWLPTQTCPCM